MLWYLVCVQVVIFAETVQIYGLFQNLCSVVPFSETYTVFLHLGSESGKCGCVKVTSEVRI